MAAKNVVIGGKTMNLFIVTDNPVPLLQVIKEKHPKSVNAQGVCDVQKDKAKTKVIIKSATGGLSHSIVSTIIKPALGNDPTVEGTTTEREKATKEHEAAEKEAEEHEAAGKGKKPKPDALAMAKASHLAAGDLDWKPDLARSRPWPRPAGRCPSSLNSKAISTPS